MKLTAKLALSQLKTNRRRTMFTLLGIALSTAMATAIYGFVATGFDMVHHHFSNQPEVDAYYATLVGLGAILSVVIVVASVIVVSNAFRVSAAERSAQFGMLKSVGATKHQIAESVLHEGLFLTMIGIPAGILLGLAVQFVGVQLINHLVADLNETMNTPLVARFIVAWQAILIAIVVAFGTVLLSAWLPAHKAARIAAIDAIRGAGEVKVKRMRSHWLAHKLFGIEGALAAKQLRRNKRNMRATVVSLSISVVLFLLVGSFAVQMDDFAEAYWGNNNATARINFHAGFYWEYDDAGNLLPGANKTISSSLVDEISARFAGFAPGTVVHSTGANPHSYQAKFPLEDVNEQMLDIWLAFEWDARAEQVEDGMFINGVLLTRTSPELHAEIAREAGVPVGSNIFINWSIHSTVDEETIELAPLEFRGQTITLIDRGSETSELTLHGQLSCREQLPAEVRGSGGLGNFTVIVSHEIEMTNISWLIEAEDSTRFLVYAEEVLDELLPCESATLSYFNLQQNRDAERDIIRLVMTFTYGFVALLTLIGLTNVISTIATSVRARAGEFAVLQSVGITRGGLRRMLHLESLLSCAKALMIGLPLGLAGAYGVNHALNLTMRFSFAIPWMPMLQCTLAVFAISWIAMRYAAAQLKNRSVIDTIRAAGI